MLKGKTALITGASGGLGASIAKALHACGIRVALSGTHEERLQNLAKTLSDSVVFPCSLNDRDQVEALVPKVEEHFGSLDILINNAGITKDGLLLRMKDDDWDQVMAVNLTAVFLLSRAALKPMMKNRFGRIINIASVVGFTGNPGQTNYCASKAGLVGFTKALAIEVASRGITVNAIAPGFIETEMTHKLNETARTKILENVPLKRMGDPEDIAQCSIYLATASYVTGETIHVNGGLAMI